MQLLSALSSTTSPLAMQAMPLVAPATGDFAALIAGMVPAGDAGAIAAPVERQAAAPAGNGLPVAIAAPSGLVATPVAAVPGTTPPVATADAVAAIAPPLPVSATEALLMLPPEADAPAAPVARGAAKLVLTATAAMGMLAEVLPDQETVETPPRAEDVAVRGLPMPVPTRFAAPQPRVKRAEAAPSDPAPEATEATEDDATDSGLPIESTAAPVVAPLIVLQPAEPIVLPAAPPANDPAPIADDAAKPAAALVIEGGKVVASEPASAPASPMRMAKRTGNVAPPSAPVAAHASATSAPAPAIGVVTPLAADQVVPAHVVVPPTPDSAVPTATPSNASPTSAPIAASPIERDATAIPAAKRMSATAPPAPATPSLVAPIAVRASRVTQPASAPLAPTTPVDTSASVIVPATTVDVPTLSSAQSVPAAAPATIATAAAALDPAAAAWSVPSAVPPVTTAPVASVAPGGLAGAMIDLPVIDGPLPNVAPVREAAGRAATVLPPADLDAATAAPVTDAAPVRSAVPPRPTARVDATQTPLTPTAAGPAAFVPVERVVAMPTPAPDTGVRAPTGEVIVDRPPIASETTAPVVPIAASIAQPGMTPPVARIAGEPLSDPVPVAEAAAGYREAIAAAASRTTDAPTNAAAATPPVTRLAAAPVAEAVPMVDVPPGDTDTGSPRPRRDDEPSIPTTGGIQAPDAAVLRPVAPTAQAAQPTLDTRQPQWVEGMIDRIATLRESSGTSTGETRIRLSPDALGDVEVAIRTGDDGKLHVHFSSDNADAGRLLADAQPRLVQMAEARGLKLAGMQVDVGSQQSGQSQRQAQDQGHAAPRAPRASTNQANTPTTRSNDRIA